MRQTSHLTNPRQICEDCNMPNTVALVSPKVAKARTERDRAKVAYDAAVLASDRATPGGLHGDPATLSGIRRRPNRRADARRHAAYDRQAAAALRLANAERDLAAAERAAARNAADAAAHRDLENLRPGDAIRTRHGWWKVARVNAKTVSVETGHSWTDRIPHAQILETRHATKETIPA